MIPVVEKRPRDDRVRTAGPTTCCSHQGYSFGCLYEECVSTASTQRDATVTPSTRSIAQVRHPVRLVDPVRVRRAAALWVPALPEVRVLREGGRLLRARAGGRRRDGGAEVDNHSRAKPPRTTHSSPIILPRPPASCPRKWLDS